ncbi:MAG: D-alanine--D-alanine ligase [Desulfobacteraceae bacterium]|nr:MAG: D-alanine--D-alanine ligase [Desulfobacteraceae bacterium]
MPEIIGIIYNKPHPGSIDSLDVLTQVDAIEQSLTALGYRPVIIPFTKDLALFMDRLKKQTVRAVFNLCETVDEDSTLCGHPAAVLELLGVPFTGSPSASLMLTTDKMITKHLVKSCGILTPKSVVIINPIHLNVDVLKFPVIVKPQFEDASIGIDQESVFTDKKTLKQRIKAFIARFGPVIIEEYIDGREFNVSLMGYPSLAPLPLAEIDFSQLPKNLFHIVGYRAKWDPASLEYHNTRRVFPEDLSPRLRRRLETTAIVCSRLLKIRDYGRIDMRVDQAGNIFVLEANANPCLSPDGGFAAAARKSGLSYEQMVSRIIESVQQRLSKKPMQPEPETALQGFPL